MNTILDDIPHLSSSDRSAFHLFASLIPRLVPVEPFLELCKGYETDMAFVPSDSGSTRSPLAEKLRDPTLTLKSIFPYAPPMTFYDTQTTSLVLSHLRFATSRGLSSLRPSTPPMPSGPSTL